MTGFDVYKRCMALSGHTFSDDEVIADKVLIARIPEFINQIATDLKIENIENLSDEINASDIKIDALISGTAMLLALTEGDGDKNRIFTEIYNSKRSAALSESNRIADVFPGVGAEGI